MKTGIRCFASALLFSATALGAQTIETVVTEANWQRHPQIKAIRGIVSSVNAGLKKGTYKIHNASFSRVGINILR